MSIIRCEHEIKKEGCFMGKHSPTEDNFNGKPCYYTPEQFKIYLDTARQIAEEKDTLTDWGCYVFFAIAYFTGMRKGEIIALKWSDIGGEIIRVRRAALLRGTSFVETPLKSDESYRSVQMPYPLFEILEKQKERYENAGILRDELRVCSGEGWLNDRQIENWNKLIASECGLPHIRIHDFRHSHAALLAGAGVPLDAVSQRLGFKTGR